MAYIGAEPVPGQNREIDDISSGFNGSATAFTLQVSSTNVSPESANNILVNLGGVMQNPGTDYTIAASTITFTTAPASGLSFWALILGAGINTATVADDTIGSSKLIDTAVTAGSYTTADITVDAQGRVTAAANGTIATAEIADGAVNNAKVNASAAIAGTKISPDFGSQAISTTGGLSINGATVFNESGADVDFRIEGDTEANLFYVDAGNNRIGIGTSTPDRIIHCHNSSTTTNVRSKFSNGTTGEGASDGFEIGINGSNPAEAVLVNYEASPMAFFTNGSQRMTIDSSGRVGINQTSFATSDTMLSISELTGHLEVGLISKNDSSCVLNFGDPEDSNIGRVKYAHDDNSMRFDVNASERMRIDSSGDVAIGTTSAGGNRLKVQLTDDNSDSFVVQGGSSQGRTNMKVQAGNTDSNSSTAYRLVNSSGTTIASFFFMNNIDDLNIMNQSQGGEIIFSTSSSSNSSGSLSRARFDMDGNFFLGKSSSDQNNTGVELMANGQSKFTRNSGGQAKFNRGTNNGTSVTFARSGTDVGSISVSTTATAYNTSSDYRLKENEVLISDGITRLKTLKPYRFNFKVDASKKVDGFFAHEVTAVPEAIIGTKDEVVTQALIDTGEYEEGTLNDPIYQGIDQSKLVPLLTAALQEAVTKIETLETKVAALEAA